VTWITLRTTSTQWEAELLQQMLEAQGIPARLVFDRAMPHWGCGVPFTLQVRAQDQWTALLLLSPIEENLEESV